MPSGTYLSVAFLGNQMQKREYTRVILQCAGQLCGHLPREGYLAFRVVSWAI